ncbi:MAG: DNA recombination protein RmuC [Thermodesulfobacteriota bacterium]
MIEILLIVVIALSVIAVVLISLLLRRTSERRLIETERLLASLEKGIERSERLVSDEMARGREENSLQTQGTREELSRTVTSFGDSLLSRMTEIATLQKNQLDTFSNQLATLSRTSDERLERMRETVEGRLRSLQEENSGKLDQMRAVVDEKLHATLEKRLGESFKLVSERLEQVYRGLGEMQSLASGVGDLKKILTNVKTRGTWGEVQLGSLLEQILTVDQYAKNVATRVGSSERVEYAVRLPGRGGGDGETVWLPIDAKFPQEDYQRLLDAREEGDAARADEAARLLVGRIKTEAKNIREKYLEPPHTTDFAIMFLPIEGLFAEVLRRPGLCDTIQREQRVTITGPTTLAALLNALQMGFRTLAIEKRSSEVWTLLGTVKTEFGKFGDILDKTQKKLQEASNTIEDAARKSRTIERKLKDVQELPSLEADKLSSDTEQ